ncbi:MAG TPA: hypothetical protein VEC13_02480 [Candidatus Paceibacterota bacterium]|nr:hypothetical protein [Candidatus Paceibacterota bacterium]
MKSSKRTLILFGILVLIFLFFWIKNRNSEPKDPIQEIIDEMPVAPEETSRNERIILAFDQFRKVAPKYDADELCKGGFINEDARSLKEVANEIIANRVLNFYPLEFATTQDEAGITCLAEGKRWVLFSALNAEDESERNYYCTDSGGRKGNLNLDREKIWCE